MTDTGTGTTIGNEPVTREMLQDGLRSLGDNLTEAFDRVREDVNRSAARATAAAATATAEADESRSMRQQIQAVFDGLGLPMPSAPAFLDVVVFALMALFFGVMELIVIRRAVSDDFWMVVDMILVLSMTMLALAQMFGAGMIRFGSNRLRRRAEAREAADQTATVSS